VSWWPLAPVGRRANLLQTPTDLMRATDYDAATRHHRASASAAAAAADAVLSASVLV